MTERISLEEGRKLMAKSQSQQPETAIKHQVRDYLRALGWLVFHNLAGVGCYKGISDFIAVKGGRVVFLEIKTATGKQSEHQKKFEADVTEHGGEYRVARSIEDVSDMGRNN